jgi:6-phosphogluconolactonase
MNSEEICVFPDHESLSHQAARTFVKASEESITARGKFAVAVSGGSTPELCYRLLASPEYSNAIDWPSIHLFWADERCVPPDHERSNFRLVKEALLLRIPFPSANIHRIRGEEGPKKAATLYAREIRGFFGSQQPPVFDLITLGVGRDGHTASLFPGSPALKEMRKLAVPVIMQGEGVGRVSLSLSVINRARRVLFLASGPEKSEIVTTIVGTEGKRWDYPAGRVRPVRGRLLWFMDKEAAIGLRGLFEACAADDLIA